MSDGPWVAAFRRKQAAEFEHWLDDLMRQPWGRGLLRQLIDSPEFCAVNGPIPHGDPIATAYRLGQRDLGIRLMQNVQRANLELYMRLLGEQAAAANLFLAAQQNDADHVPFKE